jgi:hypothetical protein
MFMSYRMRTVANSFNSTVVQDESQMEKEAGSPPQA